MQKAFFRLTKHFFLKSYFRWYVLFYGLFLACINAASFVSVDTVHHQVLAWYYSKLLHKDPKRPQTQIPVRQTRLN